jgi:hypothetical protein
MLTQVRRDTRGGLGDRAAKRLEQAQQALTRNLLHRLSQQQAAVLGFMHDFTVLFDHN